MHPQALKGWLSEPSKSLLALRAVRKELVILEIWHRASQDRHMLTQWYHPGHNDHNYSTSPDSAIAHITFFFKPCLCKNKTITIHSVCSWTRLKLFCWERRSLTLLMFSLELFGECDTTHLSLTNQRGVCLKCISLLLYPWNGCMVPVRSTG